MSDMDTKVHSPLVLGFWWVGCGNGDSTLQFKERLKRFESFRGKPKSEASKNERGREHSEVAENWEITVSLLLYVRILAVSS